MYDLASSWSDLLKIVDKKGESPRAIFGTLSYTTGGCWSSQI